MLARILLCVCFLFSFSAAQELTTRPEPSSIAAPAGTALAPNSHPVYQALRTVGLSGEIANVSNLVLKRDAGTLTLSGTFYFLQPIEGKVTGAVFLGNGTLRLLPPIP